MPRGPLLSRTLDACLGGAYIRCEHMSLSCFIQHSSPHYRAQTQEQQSLLTHKLQGFYCNNWKVHPIPNKAVTVTERRGGTAQRPVQDLHTTPVITSIKGITASTLWAKM